MDHEPHVLLLFALHGFKNYNDSYGNPAGDALLARLGARLQAATAGDGVAYRIGGDEFCVLGPWPSGESPEPFIERARAALCEEGDGFMVGASCGHALLRAEAPDAAEALRVADRRLYAEKNSGRISARIQSAQVLRRIGKIAIPRSILRKPAALDADEWAFMRRHTLIGERIAQGAPALEITLGAQILFVCDSFSAMTTDRCYKAGMSEDDAIQELRRHSGSQFSPAVVEAFEAAYAVERAAPSSVA